ncbi:MAG: (deoxy)nucleoside triphosphate pyrophosphohydrolase [Lachnospiraceae bacterium]
MKTIRVAAAVICDDMENPAKIFATAKGYGEFKGQWEFPGGKIEAGESSEEALVREIREELDTEIEVGALIHTIEYDYPAFHLSMDCFLAKVTTGRLTLREAEAARWLTRRELYEVQWLPADISLIEVLEKRMINTDAL